MQPPFFLAMGPAGQPAEQDGGFTMKVLDFHKQDGHGACHTAG